MCIRDRLWGELHDTHYGCLAWVSSKLEKVGGGHPTTAAIKQLFDKMDGDDEWYPGKLYGNPASRHCALPPLHQAAIARSAMALKESGAEPTYALVVAQCPTATLNATTGRVVDKNRI